MPSRDIGAKILLRAIALYQAVKATGLIAPTCRFFPSCSQYAREAVSGHGSVVGTFLTLRRLIKCRPLHPGGYDPVSGCGPRPEAGRSGAPAQ